ncbi:MAG: hypothetical protein RML46_05330 [Anaerolineae bacterium]|nr:hypothetical protein [Anaerolineae bacterium]MDW8068316.1 hypothetical protein [Anaerolineae bacterium]
MSIAHPHRPDPWRLAWRTATGNIPLAVCLFALAGYLLLMAWIPQFPSGPAPTDRWLVQTRFGSWTRTMYWLGLFTLGHSPTIIILLSLLAFLLLLRSLDLAETMARSGSRIQPNGWREALFPLMACLGILTLLAGLLVNLRWGWREEPLRGPAATPVPSRPGGPVRQYRIGFADALVIRATDAAGRSIGLQPTAREAAQRELVLYLTPWAPEASFAVPEPGLVIRLETQKDRLARSPIRVEVFRAPGGERVQEATMESDSFALPIDGVILEMSRQPYPLLAFAYDPGLGLKWAGLILGAIGLVGTLRPGGRKERVLGLLLSVLTLLAAGLAGYSLERYGVLGAIPYQREATALWLTGLAIWLVRWERARPSASPAARSDGIAVSGSPLYQG